MDEALDGEDGVGRVEGLLKAGAGLGAQTQLLGRLADRGGVEVGGFEQQRCRRVADLGFETAHHAGEGDGAAAGLDHQVVAGEGSFDAIEGLEAFALFGPVDLDAIDLPGVEGVHGLAEVHHDVVREIDESANGSRADVAKAELYPKRGGLCGDALDDQAGVAAAGARVADFDSDIGEVRLKELLESDEGAGFEWSAEHGGDFAGDAVVAPEIGTISDRLIVDVDDPVVENVGRERIAGLEFAAKEN